jgi:hypothetical protein
MLFNMRRMGPNGTKWDPMDNAKGSTDVQDHTHGITNSEFDLDIVVETIQH